MALDSLDETVLLSSFFGEDWDAPVTEGKFQRPTPVGDACLLCEEPIVEGDQGWWMPCAQLDGYTVEPFHMECSIRSTLGSLDHLNKKCSCYGGTGHDDGLTYRESALAVFEWMKQHGNRLER